jgi:lipopolysaccharide/colanic/teichoic acid biosynthesis glycosyltransferase
MPRRRIDVSLRADAEVPSVARSERYRPVKRALDLAICLAVMPLVAPVLLVCALAVRLDSPGPVLFTQQRTGQHGIRFGMFKFRTMVRDAEELKPSLMHLNTLPPPDFKIIDDPRITRVGRFLRRTSLDELPQILNVLRGEMSLVGPRPTSFAASTYDLWHTERLEAVPGITGLWQVRERNAATFDERLRLDVEYLQRMSLGLDLKILWWTVVAVFKRSGA